jgi:hypothetical protein
METQPITQPDNLSLGNLLNRITSPTPDFQKKLRALAIKIGVGAIIVLAVDKGVPHLVPAALVTIAKVITIAAATSAAHASTTKVTPAATTSTNDSAAS